MRRPFWIGAAALLGVAALVSIVAIVRGEFSETDGKILGTLGLTLGSGSVCLVGLALLDRGELRPLGGLAVTVGVAGYAIAVYEIWSDIDGGEWLGTSLIVMASVLLAATGRLLLRRRSLETVYVTHLVLSTVATAATVWLIWSDGPSEDWWARVIAAAWILTGLTWALVPVLGRTTRASTERVVGRGPGRVEVELADGETLVVRAG